MNVPRVARLLRELANALEEPTNASLPDNMPRTDPARKPPKRRKPTTRLGPPPDPDRRASISDADLRDARQRARKLGLLR